jgi:hypothetical protein
MARKVLKNAQIIINAVELSNYMNKVTINSEKEVLDATGFGAKSKQKALGLGDGTIELGGFQDFAAGAVDATLYPLHLNDTEFDVIVREDPDAESEYHMTGILPAYTPLNGEVGQLSTVEVTIENAGQDGIVKRASTS